MSIAILILVIKISGLINFSFSHYFIDLQRQIGSKRIPYSKVNVIENSRNRLEKLISRSESSRKTSLKKETNYKIGLHKAKTIEFIEENKSLCNNQSPAFGVYFEKFNKRTDKFGSTINPPIKDLSIVSNKQYHAFQIVITAYEDISDIQVSIADKDEIFDIYLGEYITIKSSPFSNEEITIQDPLIPFVKAKNHLFKTYRNDFKIEENNCFPIWLELRSEDSINILTHLKIHAIGKNNTITQYQIPLKIKTTPKVSKQQDIYPFLSYNHENTKRYYKNDSLVQSNFDRNTNFLIRYGLYPINLYASIEDNIKHEKRWQVLASSGARVFVTDHIGNNKYKLLKDSMAYRENYLQNIKSWESALKQKQLLEYSYIYLFDELPEKFNERLNWTTQLLKENGIKSKLISTALEPDKDNALDYHCSLMGKKILKSENEKWQYICCVNPLETNFLIESPLDAFSKVYNILNKDKTTHFLYYAINNWKGNIYEDKHHYAPYWKLYQDSYEKIKLGNRWPETPWIPHSATLCKNYAGDGYLIYPGNNGEFWPSVRLINFYKAFY